MRPTKPAGTQLHVLPPTTPHSVSGIALKRQNVGTLSIAKARSWCVLTFNGGLEWIGFASRRIEQQSQWQAVNASLLMRTRGAI
jgi:hypothetical protein